MYGLMWKQSTSWSNFNRMGTSEANPDDFVSVSLVPGAATHNETHTCNSGSDAGRQLCVDLFSDLCGQEQDDNDGAADSGRLGVDPKVRRQLVRAHMLNDDMEDWPKEMQKRLVNIRYNR
jgi:hypothetical protein